MERGAPSRYDDVPNRAPVSLGDLRGPREGEVRLPPHLHWSGPDVYDLAKPHHRLDMYSKVIVEGGRTDIERYLNPDLLYEVWPHLHRRIHDRLIGVWETRFPELAEVAAEAQPLLRAEFERARARLLAERDALQTKGREPYPETRDL